MLCFFPFCSLGLVSCPMFGRKEIKTIKYKTEIKTKQKTKKKKQQKKKKKKKKKKIDISFLIFSRK